MTDLAATYCIPGGDGLLELGLTAAASAERTGSERLATEATRFHLWAQTPPEVWEAYREAGYSWSDAMREEMSQL